MSMIVTWAPRPAAILAALMPTTPPPMITTSPGATPGTPPSSTPLPPHTYSRHLAPRCHERLRTGRDQGDAVLVRLDLLRHADEHRMSSKCGVELEKVSRER